MWYKHLPSYNMNVTNFLVCDIRVVRPNSIFPRKKIFISGEGVLHLFFFTNKVSDINYGEDITPGNGVLYT